MQAFERAVLWLLSCVGLYTLPCVAEYTSMTHAANPKTVYSDKPLIQVGLFSQSVPSTERNYTADSAIEKLGFSPAG